MGILCCLSVGSARPITTATVSMYNKYPAIIFLLLLCVHFFSGPAAAHELSGYVEGEVRMFPEDPNHAGQRDQSASFAFQPEY